MPAANAGLGAASATDDDLEWSVLLDSNDMSRWRTGVFGEDPELEVTERGVVLPIGVPLAGLTYTGEAPRGTYVLEVQATKEYGSDFFLGVTFPVRDAHLTLVLGGWGGAVCGLSCLDGLDASENDTRLVRSFPNGKLQTVTIEVSDTRVTARIDDVLLVECPLEGRALSIRPEVEPSVPLGIASFATCTTLHRVRFGIPRRSVPRLDGSSPSR
ncbi:MAG: DUF1080 domain-containing protein [Planctomycetota bacterium]